MLKRLLTYSLIMLHMLINSVGAFAHTEDQDHRGMQSPHLHIYSKDSPQHNHDALSQVLAEFFGAEGHGHETHKHQHKAKHDHTPLPTLGNDIATEHTDDHHEDGAHMHLVFQLGASLLPASMSLQRSTPDHLPKHYLSLTHTPPVPPPTA